MAIDSSNSLQSGLPHSRSDPKRLNSNNLTIDTAEPGYQLVEMPKQPPKPSTNQNQLLPSTSAPQPIGMYAEINDPGLASLRQQTSDSQLPQPRSDSRTQSHSDHSRSEPRSSPIEPHTTGSTNSDEDSKPGVALYAQVDMEMKRASRKQKQQNNGSSVYREEIVIGGRQQQHHPANEAEDSWV